MHRQRRYGIIRDTVNYSIRAATYSSKSSHSSAVLDFNFKSADADKAIIPASFFSGTAEAVRWCSFRT